MLFYLGSLCCYEQYKFLLNYSIISYISLKGRHRLSASAGLILQGLSKECDLQPSTCRFCLVIYIYLHC